MKFDTTAIKEFIQGFRSGLKETSGFCCKVDVPKQQTEEKNLDNNNKNHRN